MDISENILMSTPSTPLLKIGDKVKILSCYYGCPAGYIDTVGTVEKVNLVGRDISVRTSNISDALPSLCMFFKLHDLELVNDTIPLEPTTYDSQALTLCTKFRRMLENRSGRYEREKSILVNKLKKLNDSRSEVNTRLRDIDILRNTELKGIKDITSKENTSTLSNLLSDKLYTEIQVNSYGISATTPIIKVKYYFQTPSKKGKSISITLGKYKVYINPSQINIGNAITITNLDNVISQYHHPHIRTDDCCFGTYSDPLTEALYNQQYPKVLAILYDYVSSYYSKDWYYPVWNWLPEEKVDELFCKECRREIDMCECSDESEERCDRCDEEREHCSCARCPDSSEVLEDIFPDSMCLRCSQCKLNLDSGRWYCGMDPNLAIALDDMSQPTLRPQYEYRIIENGIERGVNGD